MIKLLEEIDEMLAAMECSAHGGEGRAITEMRGRIQTELSKSHIPVVVRGGVIEAQSVQLTEHDLKWVNSCVTRITPTKPLVGEGQAQNVCVDSGEHDHEYQRNDVWLCKKCGDIVRG